MSAATARTLTAEDRLNWLRLSRAENVGPITFYQLLSRFGSAAAALDALPELALRGGRRQAPKLPDRNALEKEIATLSKLGARLVGSIEPEYPPLLRQIPDAPPLIAFRGQASLLQKPALAIVGARNASVNGNKVAGMLAGDLGKHGFVIISGLARGIDTAAHRGSLAGGTIGVLAGGIDTIYPPENADLYAQLADIGGLVAEMPLGTQPRGRHFPRRNRVIAGIAQATIVVEAAQRSGSLLTAGLAADYGRDVLALPGSPLDPRAQGTNRLIQDGAPLVQNAADVLTALQRPFDHMRENQLDLFETTPPAPPPEDELLQARPAVLDALSPSPCPVDDLIRHCQVSASAAQVVLLELELAGRLSRLPGNRVALIGELVDDAG